MTTPAKYVATTPERFESVFGDFSHIFEKNMSVILMMPEDDESETIPTDFEAYSVIDDQGRNMIHIFVIGDEVEQEEQLLQTFKNTFAL